MSDKMVDWKRDDGDLHLYHCHRCGHEFWNTDAGPVIPCCRGECRGEARRLAMLAKLEKKVSGDERAK